MKKIVLMLLLCALLTGCTPGDPTTTTAPPETTAAPTETTVVPTEPMPTETEPAPTEITTIVAFYPDENLDHFLKTEVSAPYLTIVDALVEVGVLPDTVKVNEISWDLENKHIRVDFNGAFRDLIYTQGSTGERMIVGSVVNTFLTANDAETMSFTVEGEILESGHVIYDFPMGIFE